jgi:CheY-like chemotaxis protein
MPKVLVVDDSLSVRKVVERTLEAQGMTVLLAASAAEAKDRLERDAPDLVVCDVILPDMDGFAVCRHVKGHARAHGTPVLLMSGVINTRTREQAAQAGSEDLLPKPFAADELIRKARALLSVNGDLARAPAPAPAAPPPRGPGLRAAPPPVPRPPAPPPGPGLRPAGLPPPAPGLRPAPAPPRGPVLRSAPGVKAPAPAVSAAPRAAGPTTSPGPAPPPVTPAGSAGSALRRCLAQFVAIPGVQQALLVDRDGFVIESATEGAAEGEVVGAMGSVLGELFDGLGQDLRQGTLRRVILENEQGSVLFQIVKRSIMLVVILVDGTALGRVRYDLKRTLPELIRSL